MLLVPLNIPIFSITPNIVFLNINIIRLNITYVAINDIPFIIPSVIFLPAIFAISSMLLSLFCFIILFISVSNNLSFYYFL